MSMKVALTGDFLRIRSANSILCNEQVRNVAWLEVVLGAHHRWRTWGVDPDVVMAPSEPRGFETALGSQSRLRDYRRDPEATWAELYDADQPSVFPALFEELCKRELVVGFELPPVVKRVLHRAGTPYLSFSIHPIRFLRDLCFLVTTNSARLESLVSRCAIDPSEVDAQVRRISALIRRKRPIALQVPDCLPLLVGQTARDAVLIQHGRFAGWPDYEDTLAELLACHEEVVFLEHPRTPLCNSSAISEYFRSRLGKTVISVQGNGYGFVFSDSAAPACITLASSLGIEAQCAGMPCEFLLGDPGVRQLVAGVDLPNAMMVGHQVLMDEFWRGVLLDDSPVPPWRRGKYDDAFRLGENYLRDTVDNWAYSGVRGGLNLPPVRKRILPVNDISMLRAEEISDCLAGWGSEVERRIAPGRWRQFAWGQVQMLEPPLADGQERLLSFASPVAEYYLVEGFHPIEHWGVWSSGEHCQVVLPLCFGSASRMDLQVEMTLCAHESVIEKQPLLRVEIEGVEVASTEFNPSSGARLNLNFKCTVSRPDCLMNLCISHTIIPMDEGDEEDGRVLGIGLGGVRYRLSAIHGIAG